MFASPSASTARPRRAPHWTHPHARPGGVSCVVVRPAGLSNAPGEGKYDVALADGTVGASVAREDVARFMLTLVADQKYDNGAVSVGGNAPRTGH